MTVASPGNFDAGTPDPRGDRLDSTPVPIPDGLSQERRHFVLSKNSSQRLDTYLHSRLKGISRHQVQKLITLGGVLLNDRIPKPSASLRCGDVVEVLMPPRPTVEMNPQPMPLKIIHEEPGFIVINKQAGLIVHPARSHLHGTLLNGLAHHFQEENQTLSSVGRREARPGVIHRLDMNTTGVIVVAKQDSAHWAIAKQFEDRSTLKAYLAVVHGAPNEAGGVIDQPIGKHPTIHEAQSIRHDSSGKPSVTVFRVLERYHGYSLVELELRTGRTHQIRVHLSYLGHPLVGDIIYGGEVVGLPEIDQPPPPAGARPYLAFARTKEQGTRIEQLARKRADVIMSTPALHAALLRFSHPDSQKPVTFTAPVPQPLATLIGHLRAHLKPGPVATDGCHVNLNQAVP